MADKTLYIIGGPNGAGKTTFAGKLLASTALEYIGRTKSLQSYALRTQLHSS